MTLLQPGPALLLSSAEFSCSFTFQIEDTQQNQSGWLFGRGGQSVIATPSPVLSLIAEIYQQATQLDIECQHP